MATLKQAIEYAKLNPSDARSLELMNQIKSGRMDGIARKEGIIIARYGQEMINEGLAANIITQSEADEIVKYDLLLSEVIDVDDFEPEIYKSLK